MGLKEKIKRAISLLSEAGSESEFNSYLKKLKKEDPVVHSVVQIYWYTMRYQSSLSIRQGQRIMHRVKEPWVKWYILILMGEAYRNMGEMKYAESSFMKAFDIARKIGDKECISRTRFQIYTLQIFRSDYQQACRELVEFRNDPDTWEAYRADYLLGVCALVQGKPDKAIKSIDSFLNSLKLAEENPLRFGPLEMRALALRLKGNISMAMEAFVEIANKYVEYGAAYSAFPLAKALELSRLAGMKKPPNQLVAKALSLAKKGSWGEQAAAQEIKALLEEDDVQSSKGLFESCKNYIKAYQNIEAVFSGLTAAKLAWDSDSPVFTKALKLIAPLMPLHPGLKDDPLLRGFINRTMPLMNQLMSDASDTKIKAYLIGEFRVLVGEEEITISRWHNNKAIKAFVYLLLSPKHRIATDHLFYLLWPRRAYNRKNKINLYMAISAIRKHLGQQTIITKKHSFYQLEDTWTDLGELEDMVRLAEATQDPDQKEDYLSRARELAKGELLPEFPYDRHIDEYRQYYKRLIKKIFPD